MGEDWGNKESGLKEFEVNWYVIKTKPQKESHVRRQLARAQFEVFLPLMRTIASVKPLFPTYLFIFADLANPQTHRLVRFTRGVSRVLSGPEGPQTVPDDLIQTLISQTRDGSLIEQDLLFKEGDVVTVKRGILKDLQGIIEQNLSEKGRIRVLFKWLNSTMRAVLKYTDLERNAA